MKWINLAERQPVDTLWDQIVMRKVESKHVQDYMEIATIVFLPESWKDYEWLDETRDTMLIPPLSDSDKAWAKELHELELKLFYGDNVFFREDVDKLLAEQHRNTRHDAIDVVNTYFNELQDQIPFPEVILDSITKGIMNLKQRKP